MGVDFLQTAGKRIKVARDKDLIGLAEGDLFTRRLQRPAMHELLRLMPGKTLAPGDEVQIELNGDDVVAVVGETIVGEFDSPMPALVELLEQHGIVGGRIDEVHEGARVADVEILE
jgi:hypothetical protein